MGVEHRYLQFYTSNKKNGKMSKKVYLEQILKVTVQSWLDKKEDFILEEDQDSRHGISQKRLADGSWWCPVRRWKESKGFEYFFNALLAPDLSPIENM